MSEISQLQINDNTYNICDATARLGLFPGLIQMSASPILPSGWLFCDGSEVSRTLYSSLYAAIGTTWGAGDGSTTFNLPDLRGRTAVGVDLNGSVDSYTTSRNMLLTDSAQITQEQYCAYALKTAGRSLAANTRYTLQLFDVHIAHSAKTETSIGLGVWWGKGGTANHFIDIFASPNNDGETSLKSYTTGGSTYAYCKHLTITLDTTGVTQGGDFLNIYNSPSEASGTRSMEIGRWMLNAEADGPLPWEPRRWFHRYGAYDLGTFGGIDHPDIMETHLPSHIHSIPSHTHSMGSSWSTGSGSSGAYMQTQNRSTTTHNTGAWSGNTGSAGGGNSFDIRSPYATVNYIIYAG